MGWLCCFYSGLGDLIRRKQVLSSISRFKKDIIRNTYSRQSTSAQSRISNTHTQTHIHIHIHTYTHTHTHTYIYIYIKHQCIWHSILLNCPLGKEYFIFETLWICFFLDLIYIYIIYILYIYTYIYIYNTKIFKCLSWLSCTYLFTLSHRESLCQEEVRLLYVGD